MSASIEDKIIKLTFQNEEFEKRIKTSEESINKFKKSIEFNDAEKNFKNLEKVVSNTSAFDSLAEKLDNITSKFSSLSIVGATALAKLTSSAMNKARGLAAQFMDPVIAGGKNRALNLQQARFQFKGLGMDVEEAMKNSLAAVQGTAYGLDSAAKVASQLGASGIKLGEDMTSTLTGIAGVAAMTSSSFDDIGNIFTSVAGNGRLMGQHLVSLSARGLNVAASIGKLMNRSEEEIRELVTQGRISFKLFAKAMDETFGEHSTKANETYAGSLSNVRSALARIGEQVATPYFENQIKINQALIPVINALNVALKPLIDTFNALSRASAERKVNFLKNLNLEPFALIVKGINNVLKGLLSILEPIKQAFRNIFPKTDGKIILKLATAFERLTSNFKMGEKTANNIRVIFKAIFILLDIGLRIIGALIGAVVSLASVLKPIIKFFLAISGALATWISETYEILKANNLFAKSLFLMTRYIQVQFVKIKWAISSLVDKINSLKFANTSGVRKFSENVLRDFNPIIKIGEFLDKVLTKLKDTYNKIKPVILSIAAYFSKIFSSISQQFTNNEGYIEFERIIRIINGILTGGLLLSLKAFVQSLWGFYGKDVTPHGKDLMTRINDILITLRSNLIALTQDIKANVVKKIAISVGILALSLVVLSAIDPGRLTVALGAMTGLFVNLFGATTLLFRLLGNANILTMFKLSKIISGLAIAMYILVRAVKVLSNIEADGLLKGLFSLLAISGIMILIAQGFSYVDKDLRKSAVAMILMGFAINIIAKAIKKLSEIKATSLLKAMMAFGYIIGNLAVFSIIAQEKDLVKTAIGIAILALAMNVFVKAIQKFAKIPWTEMIYGLVSISAIFGMLAGFSRIVKGPSIIAFSIGAVILSFALSKIADIIIKLAKIQFDTALGAVGVIGLILTQLVAVLVILSKFGPATLLGAISVGLLSISLYGIIGIVKILSMLPHNGVAAVGVLALILTTLAGAMFLMNYGLAGGIGGAVAIGLISIALGMLIPILLVLSQIPFKVLLMGLGGLAAIFAVIGLAGFILAPVIPILLAFGVGLLMLSTSLILGGIGLSVFATGLAALSAVGYVAIKHLVTLIPHIVEQIGLAFVKFLEMIGKNGAAIFTAIYTVLSAIVAGIGAVLDKVVIVVVDFLVTLLGKLNEKMPEIAQGAMNIILTIYTAIKDNMYMIVEASVGIITAFINGLADNLHLIVNAGWNFIVSYIYAMADGIDKYAPLLKDAILYFMQVIIQTFIKIIKESLPVLRDIGMGILEEIKNGFSLAKEGLIKFVADIGLAIINIIKSVLKINSPSGAFAGVGVNCVQGLVKGFRDTEATATQAAEDLGKKTLKSTLSGWWDGIKAGSKKVAEGTSTLFEKAQNKAEDYWMKKNPTEPIIKPIVDLGNIDKGAEEIKKKLKSATDWDSLLLDGRGGKKDIGASGARKAAASYVEKAPILPEKRTAVSDNQNGGITFIQNNTSPLALSRLDIYRQTRNQINSLKGIIRV